MSESMGEIIRKLRRERGLTQEELAEQLNVSAQAVSKWENNLGMPDISQVVPLAHFFHVSTDLIFGLSVDSAVNPIESLIQQATASESYLEEYKILKDALRSYPGDMRLLSELLSCGKCILSDGDTASEQERLVIYEECEKAGLLVLSYCKETAVIYNVTQWMVRLYCEMGDTAKATAMADMLPENTLFNKSEALGRICETEKQYISSAEQYEANLSLYCHGMIHCLIMSGNMYVHAQDLPKAIVSYQNAITFGENLLSDQSFPLSNAARKNIQKQVAQCQRRIKELSEK